MSRTEPLPGTSDMQAEESRQWRWLEGLANTVFERYGYGELRTPIIERSEVFQKTIGDETDIVQKEMYCFKDNGGRNLTLRPEGTAGVMRAIANIGVQQGDEKRVWYLGPMFRGERPAAGRKRQFHQIGVENVGKCAPYIDVECIAMLVDFIQSLKINNVKLLINSRGTKEDRPVVAKALYDYFKEFTSVMCEDDQRRLETNVWRILDSKDEAIQEIISNAPRITDLLSDESKSYFQTVCNGLDTIGIDYILEPRLVRGLDYYEHTVFELTYDGIGAQTALAGGGRYKITPPGVKNPLSGVGFAAGIERLFMTLEDQGSLTIKENSIDIYLISLGEKALDYNLGLAKKLRSQGKTVMMELEGRGMKAQMRTANKLNAKYSYILGDNELEQSIIIIKDMQTSEQSELSLSELT